MDWTSMRQFDVITEAPENLKDQSSDCNLGEEEDWVVEEEKKLQQQYGGDYIKLKISSQGVYGYYCELCLSECNHTKSLDSHCAGMKHLKKKSMYEATGQKPEPPGNSTLLQRRLSGKPTLNPVKSWGSKQGPRPSMTKKALIGSVNNGQTGGENVFGRPLQLEPFVGYSKSNPPSIPIEHISKETRPKGPAGVMLEKLSECCIQDQEDAQLALNVISALTKSLKEYNDKKGERKVAELYLAAEIKLNTVKTLEGGLQVLSQSINQQNSSSTTNELHLTSEGNKQVPKLQDNFGETPPPGPVSESPADLEASKPLGNFRVPPPPRSVSERPRDISATEPPVNFGVPSPSRRGSKGPTDLDPPLQRPGAGVMYGYREKSGFSNSTNRSGSSQRQGYGNMYGYSTTSSFAGHGYPGGYRSTGGECKQNGSNSSHSRNEQVEGYTSNFSLRP